ncbi:hypothetical protein [Haladaptatus salinisoli]|uniref:hypothetical protein n=1 Tax=Haladaptatus salinisoli TaxID=2884876 RepID=UPI001D0BC3BD|nr:hypothetical protein [Haladaptatus salinisoli]
MTMKLKALLTVTLAIALLSTVLVGSSMAQEQANEFEQEADAEVEQYQDVEQLNVNEQSDNVAASSGGDATAVQASEQFNSNSQTGVAVASNTAEDIEQENEADDECDGILLPDGTCRPPAPS